VRGTQAYLIDADSFQFGQFLCQVYTERFVDPLLCDANATRPVLVRPYGADSDWYAFAVMLFRSLLLVDPYGGVYTPKNPSQHLPHSARPLHRITVFDPAVRYPKPAYRYEILPNELLQYFHEMFRHDLRGVFPLALLDHLQWVTCAQCQLEYASAACPACGKPVVHAGLKVRGKVTATQVLEAPGPLVWATVDNGTLRYLIHANGSFYREGQRLVCAGQLHPHMSFRLLPDKTLIGQGNQLVILSDRNPPERLQVDTCAGMPVFDSHGLTYFWVQDGQLMRAGMLGPERLGDVLAGQTRIWVGAALGFGFYRAGDLHVAFVFDPSHRGLNDNVRLPAMRGHLVDVACQLASDRCWLMWSTQEQGRMVQHMAVILANGTVAAAISADAGTVSWMGAAHGALAVGAFLLVPTDAGIARVEVSQGQIVLTRTFPDTEPFVDAASRLLAAPGGVYVVRGRTIHLLTLDGG
jgi:H/ACA ribonucleoprotein complex subunit 3